MMQCCAVGNDCDLGDFIIDHCARRKRGAPSDVLNSPGLTRLRAGLLTGDLRPMCRRCFFADDRLITTEELTARVKAHLAARLPAETDVHSLDLTLAYAYKEMAIAFTNRCNQRCVYCVQSTQAKHNPWYSLDFPEEYTENALDFFAAQGIDQVRTCVEGEPTFYPRWHQVFSAFKARYPHIALYMTTNLSRRYSEQEMDLLARYEALDVSCDTLDPSLYRELRRGGKLETVLANIRRVQAKVRELGLRGPRISLHAVVSDRTWPSLGQLVEYAFANGLVPLLGNYEERANASAYRENICRPISTLPLAEQSRAREFLSALRDRLLALGHDPVEYIQGGLLYNLERRVERNFNRFAPYDANPLHKAFHTRHPCGTERAYLDIVYDYDNIAYSGVLFARPPDRLRLEGLQAREAVVREISVYRAGACSTKYGQTVQSGYRRILDIPDGVLEYAPVFGEGVEKVLLEFSEWR